MWSIRLWPTSPLELASPLEARALRVQQDLRGAERRGAEKHDPAEILTRRLGVRIDHAHARRSVPALVVDDAVDDCVGDDGETPRQPRRRERRRETREVAAETATAGALIAGLAGPAAQMRLREVRDARDRHAPSRKGALDAPLHHALGAVHLPRRQKLAVGEMAEAQLLSAHAHEALHVRVPGRELAVADRPIDAVTVARV